MKLNLIVFFIWAFGSIAFSNNREFKRQYTFQPADPECVTVLNKNISKVEAGIKKLQASNESGTPPSVFKRDLLRWKSTIAGLDKSILACKSSNPEYDFSEVDTKISNIKSDFDLMENKVNANTEAENIKKTWIDVNKYSIYVLSFPTSHPPQLDMAANWIFSQEEVTFFLSDKSDDEKLKQSLRKFIFILESESTKKAFLSSVSDMKHQLDKETAIKELDFLIRDVKHLGTVFLANENAFLEVVNAASKMKRYLSQ